MTEVHDALAEAPACSNLQVLVERGRLYQQTVVVHAEIGSGYAQGIMEHTIGDSMLVYVFFPACSGAPS